ncbi:hypothetical protein [Nocardia sp. NPDC050793]|uniref:DUF7373 family lipoprotein n=1 Tax=Nocardia sp. NPDC050793 TaxID=3155159 RepID=UPI0033CF4250
MGNALDLWQDCRVRSVLRVGALVAAMIALSSCYSDDVPASVATTTSAAPTSVLTPDQRRHQGMLAEGTRMADVLALPTDIDPDVTVYGRAGVLTSATLLVMAGHNDAIKAAADDNGLLTGAITHRTNGDRERRKDLTHGVMRFPDAAAASKAAEDLADGAVNYRGLLESQSRTAAPLPGAPETQFSHKEERGRVESMAFTAVREYVIYTWVRAGSREELERITLRALELQRPLLDEFRPTAAADYPELPYDPDGVFALAVGDGDAQQGAYRQRGAMLFAPDQPRAATLFREVGLNAMANKGTTVYRADDAAGAQRLSAALGEMQRAYQPAQAPAGIPSATCLSKPEGGANSWFCLVTAGRYVGEIWAKTQDDAHRLLEQQHQALRSAK